MAGAALRLKMAFSSTSPSITLGARAPCAAAAAMWARVPKNVKKPQGEKGRTFKKSKMLFGA